MNKLLVIGLIGLLLFSLGCTGRTEIIGNIVKDGRCAIVDGNVLCSRVDLLNAPGSSFVVLSDCDNGAEYMKQEFKEVNCDIEVRE